MNHHHHDSNEKKKKKMKKEEVNDSPDATTRTTTLPTTTTMATTTTTTVPNRTTTTQATTTRTKNNKTKKKKRYDYRHEVDIGQAVAHQLLLSQSQNLPPGRKRPRSSSSSEPAEDAVLSHTALPDEEEEDPQVRIYQQLSLSPAVVAATNSSTHHEIKRENKQDEGGGLPPKYNNTGRNHHVVVRLPLPKNGRSHLERHDDASDDDEQDADGENDAHYFHSRNDHGRQISVTTPHYEYPNDNYHDDSIGSQRRRALRILLTRAVRPCTKNDDNDTLVQWFGVVGAASHHNIPWTTTTTRSLLLEHTCRQNGRDLLEQMRPSLPPPFQSDHAPGADPSSSLLTSRGIRTTADLDLLLVPPVRIGYRMDRRHDNNDDVVAPALQLLPPNTVLIPPTTTYVPRPGTLPPPPSASSSSSIPQLLLFGPTDRYEHVVHTDDDESLVRVRIATLVSQMCCCCTDQNDERQRQRQQLLLYSTIQQMIQSHQKNQYYQRLRRQYRQPHLELPLADYARAWNIYGAVVWCWGRRVLVGTSTTTSGTHHDNDDDDDAMHDDDAPNDLYMVMNHLFECLEQHHTHNGLQMFPSFHLFYAVVRIGTMLPASGVSRLMTKIWRLPGRKSGSDESRHGGNDDDTPIALFRRLLEHLEEHCDLVSTEPSSTTRQTLNVGELEYTLYRASVTVLDHCIAREPWSVLSHAWYVAIVASSLLLCSGQQIVATSSSTNTTGRTTATPLQPPPAHHGSGATSNMVYYVIRRTLPKFQELRKQTATAFREMVQISTQYPNQQRPHSAIVSFLEWDQVVSLLLGPSMNSNRLPTEHYDLYYDHFRTLHKYHKTQWAHQENTCTAYQSLRLCATDLDSVRDIYLHELASALENDPSNLDHWCSLAQALGPIGAVNHSSTCEHLVDGQECDCLVKDRTIDHTGRTKRNQNTKWWGYDRRHWWYDCLLQPYAPPPHSNLTTGKRRNGRTSKGDRPTNVDTTGAAYQTNLIHQLKQLEPFQQRRDSASISSTDDCDGIVSFNDSTAPPFEEWFDTFLTYLDHTSATQKDDLTPNHTTTTKLNKTKNQTNQVYIPFLQQENTNIDSRLGVVVRDDDMDLTPRTTPAVSMMILSGHQVLIWCHLESVAHIGVDRHVTQLWDQAIRRAKSPMNNDDDDNNAALVLRWLYRMGLDVTHDRYTRPHI